MHTRPGQIHRPTTGRPIASAPSGWERRLLKLSVVEAALNLGLSLALVFRFGVLGVAIGTLIPSVLIGWLWALPLTAKFAEIFGVRKRNPETEFQESKTSRNATSKALIDPTVPK